MKEYRSWMAGLLTGFLCFSVSCVNVQNDEEVGYVNVPLVAQIEQNVEGKGFALAQCQGIVFPEGDTLWQERAEWLAQEIWNLTDKRLVLSSVPENREIGWIRFQYEEDLKEEGFHLEVNENKVTIGAKDASGIFYGAQMLVQVLSLQNAESPVFPACKIVDYPELHYRGAMLDVSRNFFSLAQVKQFIDMLAAHRLNYFHWHLTDDQGWRIEIKKYPKLTEIGAWQGEGSSRKGGFYTQEEVKEIVKYASLRGITVIPEIDLPGHSTAALAAYPMLGCTGGPYQVAKERGGVHKDVLCLGNEDTYTFAKEVLTEVAALFPAPFVHIGGDEVPRDRWKACPKCQQTIVRDGLKGNHTHSAEDLLQGEFNRRMAEFLKTLGKQMVGWDEILADNIDKKTVIMSWRGLGRGAKALKAGHPVIFSSNGHFYLNNYQAEDMDREPAATGGLVEMQKVYEADWNTPDLSESDKKRILGAEVCLWTSYVEDTQTMEYMMLPRLAAFAELAWSGSRRTGYVDFLNRLPDMLALYKERGWQPASHYFKIEAAYHSDIEKKQLEVELKSLPEAEIYYTLDGSVPSRSSFKYSAPFCLSESSMLTAIAYSPKGLVADTLRSQIKVSKSTFCPVSLKTTPAVRYEGKNGKVLADGVRSKTFHTTGMWVGYDARPLKAVIDLMHAQPCSKVIVSSLTDMSSYIMGIKQLEIYLSADGNTYKKVAEQAYTEPPMRMEGKKVMNLELDFETTDARYVKVCAKGFGALPAWHSGAGATPFLFVDEIEVY